MGVEIKEKSVDGCVIRTSQHPARSAARLLARVAGALGPALGALKGLKVDDKTKLDDIDLGAIAPALTAAFDALAEAEADKLIEEVLKHTTITMPDGRGEMRMFDLSRGEMIDEAFTGSLGLMMRTVVFALGANFGGFFRELVRSGPAVPAVSAVSLST